MDYFFLLICFGSLQLSLAFKGNYDTSTLISSNFESGSLSPFVTCNVESPSFVDVDKAVSAYSGSYVVHTFFDEAVYDGTRNRRGAEFCSPGPNDFLIHKEGWQGFAFYLPSSWPASDHAIIAQQFCGGGSCSSWCGTLEISAGSLVVNHRTACVDPTTATIVSSITRNTWHKVVINSRFSNIGDGRSKVWYDGSVVYDDEDINFGFDASFTANGSLTTGAYFKNGQYDYGEFFSSYQLSI